jgi:hypothetical protein
LSKEASVQSLGSFDRAAAAHIAKILVVPDQKSTAPIGGAILCQQGLRSILEPFTKKATDFWLIELSDPVRNRSL